MTFTKTISVLVTVAALGSTAGIASADVAKENLQKVFYSETGYQPAANAETSLITSEKGKSVAMENLTKVFYPDQRINNHDVQVADTQETSRDVAMENISRLYQPGFNS
ncbi:MAG: hypothetical protein OQK12_16285 [Motiliproteus sp.]|nr:hypothetical protein [Motiliproteus sp.]